MRYYYEHFSEVSGSRSYSSNGVPLAISYTEIRAYFELTGIPKTEWQDLTRWLKILDVGWLSAASKKSAGKSDH